MNLALGSRAWPARNDRALRRSDWTGDCLKLDSALCCDKLVRLSFCLLEARVQNRRSVDRPVGVIDRVVQGQLVPDSSGDWNLYSEDVTFKLIVRVTWHRGGAVAYL